MYRHNHRHRYREQHHNNRPRIYRFALHTSILLTLLALSIDAKCENPPELDEAYVTAQDENKSYEEGDTVSYKCDMGSYKDPKGGPGTASCEKNGTWIGPDIRCLSVRCGRLDDPQHGQIVGTNVTFGAIVTFECNRGYDRWTKNRIFERVCNEDGTWNSDQFECRPKKCPDLSDPADGEVSSKTGVYREKVTYSCHLDHLLEGSDVRECLENGTWSSVEPKCVKDRRPKQCPSPISTLFKNSHRHLTDTNVPLGIKIGHAVTFICKSNSNLTVASVCDDSGNWHPPPPTSVYCGEEEEETTTTTTAAAAATAARTATMTTEQETEIATTMTTGTAAPAPLTAVTARAETTTKKKNRRQQQQQRGK